MSTNKVYHSICRWTFHSGKGGFLPAGQRPEWDAKVLSSAQMVKLVREKIAPRLPEHVALGIELHYDTEVDDSNAREIADALVDCQLSLAMITPGAHSHYGYGGIASLDPREREGADALGFRTVDVAYGALRKAWSSAAEQAPSFVLWNGSYGYDMATIGVREMYQNLKKSIAGLCQYEEKKGGLLSFGIEPKPNEGHPAMLLPTVASAIVLWRKLHEEFGLSLKNKGINKEFGHSEMIGLDHVYDTVEELDNQMVMHVHLNSQGYNDGIILGGPGKYDIDHGTRINGMNIAIAGLLSGSGYQRWYGHDMQVRPYDNEVQGIDRVVRSVLSWDACQIAAKNLDEKDLLAKLERRETAKVEDIMRHAVMDANRYFDEIYNQK